MPLVQVVPLAVGADEGGGDEVCLWSNNEVTFWCGVDLSLPYQHVQRVPQDLWTWTGYT